MCALMKINKIPSGWRAFSVSFMRFCIDDDSERFG